MNLFPTMKKNNANANMGYYINSATTYPWGAQTITISASAYGYNRFTTIDLCKVYAAENNGWIPYCNISATINADGDIVVTHQGALAGSFGIYFVVCFKGE